MGLTWTDDGFIPDNVNPNLKEFGHKLIVPIVPTVPNSPMAHGKTISHTVSSATLRGWFDLCHQNNSGHHNDCLHKPLTLSLSGTSTPDLSRLRLYGVKDNLMHDYRAEMDYAVLSYVIGDVILPSFSDTELTEYKKTKLPVSQLPYTYRDAI